MRIGPLRSYAPSIRRKLLLGAVSSVALTTFFPGAVFAADFTQSKYRNGAMGAEVTNPALLPGWNFSRTSAGYAETKDGRLVAFGAGEPRITDRGLLVEEARTNYVSYSQDFSTGVGWTITGPTLANTNNSAVAPDGSMTAASLVRTSSSGGTYLSRSVSGVVGETWTFSVYAKARNIGGAIGLRVQGTFPDRGDALFNLNTGTLIGVQSSGAYSGTSASIVALGNGWYRCSITTTSANTPPGSVLMAPAATNAIVTGFEAGSTTLSDAYIWGAQVEKAAFATSYIPTNGAAATRAADSAYIAGLGSILGQFRTNLLTQSQVFSGSSPWAKLGVIADDNVAAAPDGTMTAARLTVTAGTGTRAIYRNNSTGGQIGVTAGVTYTMRWSVKQENGVRYIHLPLASAGFSGNRYANFDIQTGVVTQTSGASVSAGIVPTGNGWWTIYITSTADITANGIDCGYLYPANSGTATFGAAFTGATGTESFLFWGGDMKVGGFSNYIPTTSSPVTEGNPLTFTAVADMSAADNLQRSLIMLSDGTIYNRADIRRGNANGANLVILNGGITTASLATAPGVYAGAKVMKAAARLRPTTTRFVNTNGAIGQISPTSLPQLNLMEIGQGRGGGAYLNGYIQRIGIFGDVDDATLQTLTA